MDKIRIDFFDILGYIIPGSALLIVVWIAADSQVCSIWQVYNSVHNIDERAILTGLFLSYITGFILHALGSDLYNRYLKVFPLKLNESFAANIPVYDKWTIIREAGEKHIPLLERWYALRAFSQNLCIISLISIIVCIYKWVKFGYYEWGFMVLVFVVSFIFFIERAKAFHKVLDGDMNSILRALHKNKDLNTFFG